ncbi:MAG: hypothetical protein V1725_04140 [archaeon]
MDNTAQQPPERQSSEKEEHTLDYLPQPQATKEFTGFDFGYEEYYAGWYQQEQNTFREKR